MERTYKKMSTKLVHAGEPDPRIEGAVIMPIFQSATFQYTGEKSYDAVRYLRLNNTPNHLALHRKLAAVENGEAALVTASGMAAISTTLLTVLSAGDHLLAQDCLYGGTFDFLTRDFSSFGLTYDFVPAEDPDAWKKKLRPNTKAFYCESMTNPLMQVADLDGIVRFCRENGLVSMIDNTFPSPVNFRPSEHGFDISLHSATKYLNGHSDIVAGAVIGKSEWINKITLKLNLLGGTLDPHAAFLLHRGLKTLTLRVGAQNSTALRLASFLERHPAVAAVNYPGLESHPRHRRAQELFDGFSGMFSFEVKGGVDAAERFMRGTRLTMIAPSLGGIETLLTRPATTSHAGLSPADRLRLGIAEGLIRVSVGLEDSEDLVEDFAQALK